MTRGPVLLAKRHGRQVLPALVLAVLPLSTVVGEEVRIIQTNSRGDNIHIIDPATHEIVAEIAGVPINHGVAAAPDGSRLYITSEVKRTVDVIDVDSLEAIASIPLSGRPNNITITPDGRKVYVAIRSEPGGVDIIDTVSLETIKTLPTDGGMHNTFATPDGKYILAGATGGQHLLVIDAASDEPLWRLFDRGVRPIAIEPNSDGSTNRLFVELTNLHGFAIVDFATRQIVREVTLPDDPPPSEWLSQSDSPSHGIGVAPDGGTLWVNSRRTNHVYVYSLPDVEYVGKVETSDNPNWMTFTPDSRHVYIACSGANEVMVIDVVTRTPVARIAAGPNPQRNITAVLR